MWRRAVWLLGLSLAGVAALPSAPAAAAGPTSVTINGPGLPQALTVRAAERPDRFKALLSEVDWLAARPGNAPNPDPASLGPKYQLVVLVDEVADQTYDVFPLARGGPRVFRPAEQPKRAVAAAWFYGRVSMPDSLRDAGVPLALRATGDSGGEGGGGAVPGRAGTGQNQAGVGQHQAGLTGAPAPGASVNEVMRQWLQVLLIVAGGSILLLLMLGYVSLLTRR